MSDNHITKKVAEKIVEMRKEKGLTQDEVAKQLGIHRASYAQSEVAKRNLTTVELVGLSNCLGFSLPVFLNEVYGVSMKGISNKPIFNYRRFKSIALYFLNKLREHDYVGPTKLNLLLYFSDFKYFEKHTDYLTGLSYSKMPSGPVPGIDHYVSELGKQKEIDILPAMDLNDAMAVKYVAMVKPDLRELTHKELEIIDSVLEIYSPMNTSALIELSHKDPPWLETENMFDQIDYSLVFKRNTLNNI
jgi:DNA-binding XRE family transcriptional regulator/uncharacterized phage-associated protein